jgi:acyl carrier protein
MGAKALVDWWSWTMQQTAVETRAPVTDRVRQAVVASFEATALAQDRTLAPLADDLVLVDSGLDSLCFAIIVAQLEDDLGLDPFSDLDDAFFPVTFKEFVRLYEGSAQAQAG